MRDVLIVALVLACPFAMALMMRGGHGHGGHRHAHGTAAARSLSELRAQRAELDRLIEDCEDEEAAEASRRSGRA